MAEPQAVKKPLGVGALLRGKPKPAQLQKPTAEMVQGIQKPPTLATEIAPQPFYGDPVQQEAPVAPPPMARVGPLIRPPMPVAAARPALPTLRFLKKPKQADFSRADFKQRDRDIDEQDDFDDLLPQEFLDYQEKQRQIEEVDPYLTKTTVYVPQSRKSFYRFVNQNYGDVFRLLPQVKGRIDEEACAKLEQKAGAAVESFLYQKFVREYIRNAAPYRGMLVYHGLGSGKTCSAIAAAEALYGTSDKGIVVMTPFSLRGNFMSEISFCGFRHFSMNNHWVELPLPARDKEDNLELETILAYGRSVLSLSDTYLRSVRLRKEEERRVLWVPDFTKPPNDDILSPQERDDIREQITATIESRITFISYNGVTAAQLKSYACQTDPVTGARFFDNKVIVIDEFHNLTRLMQGEIVPYITQRKGRKRKIAAEPIVPGRWVPSLCNKPMNYKRAYLFYRLLTDARQSKIIGLSGTPLINFPEELGIMANVLAGYIECVEVYLNTTDPAVLKRFRTIAEAEDRVDMIRFRAANQQMQVLISVFSEGYVRVDDKNDNFVGVTYDEDATQGIREVYQKIKARAQAEKLPIGEETFVSYPRLPIDGEEFRQEFIGSDLSIQNRVVLQKRLTGLISYYKGSKEEYMPRVIKDEVVQCEMSDYTLSMYTVARNMELKGEMQKDQGGGDVYAAVEMFAKMKNPSSYRFRSRALCNFAFPKAIDRPFPTTHVEEEAAVAAETAVIAEDVEVSEMVANMGLEEAEKAAAEAIEAEEAQIEAEEAEVAPAVPEAAAPAVPEVAVPAVPEAAEAAPEVDIFDIPEAAVFQQGGEFELDEWDDQSGGADDARPPPPPSKRRMPVAPVAASAAPVAASAAPAAPSAALSAVPLLEVAAPSAAPLLEPIAPVLEASEPSQPALPAPKKRSMPPPLPVEEPAAPAAPALPAPKKRSMPPPLPVEEPAAPAAPAAPKKRSMPPPLPVEEPVQPVQAAQPMARTLSYAERVQRAMARLDADRALYMNLDHVQPERCIRHYSMKLDHMMRRIQASKGSNLVYSQFLTVEGLGVLGIALKANGYEEIQITGSDSAPQFSPQTLASFAKGPEAGIKRFITFTGQGSKDRRTLILNIFNGHFNKLPESMQEVLEPFQARANKYGDICWVIGITGAGAEGISLKCCRSVHIMEPYWNTVRQDQVKGRAIRICSHKDLPFAEREVEIYTYYSVFSEEQRRTDKIDMHIKMNDEGETSDQKVYNVSKKKEQISKALLEVMQESAVDCGLNAADNDGVQCFVVEGRPDQYMFDPNLEVDKILTSIELKEVVKTSAANAPSAKPAMRKVPVIRVRGEEYMLQDKPNMGGAIMQLFGMRDSEFRKPLGEVSVDPITGAYRRLRFY